MSVKVRVTVHFIQCDTGCILHSEVLLKNHVEAYKKECMEQGVTHQVQAPAIQLWLPPQSIHHFEVQEIL
jgi:hypothetical protein